MISLNSFPFISGVRLASKIAQNLIPRIQILVPWKPGSPEPPCSTPNLWASLKPREWRWWDPVGPGFCFENIPGFCGNPWTTKTGVFFLGFFRLFIPMDPWRKGKLSAKLDQRNELDTSWRTFSMGHWLGHWAMAAWSHPILRWDKKLTRFGKILEVLNPVHGICKVCIFVDDLSSVGWAWEKTPRYIEVPWCREYPCQVSVHVRDALNTLNLNPRDLRKSS